jgi:hypothetical protein
MANSPDDWDYHQPPKYPQGPVTPGSAAPPDQPTAIRRALYLMYAGAVVAVIQGTVEGLTLNNVTYTYSTSPSSATVHTGRSLAAGIIEGIILAGLWLWMAWKNGAGRNWARVLSSVFFGLLCLQFIGSMVSLARSGLPVVDFIARLAEWGIGLVAILYLWQRDVTEFVASVRQARLASRDPAPYPGHPSPGDGQPPYNQPPQYGDPPYNQPPYGQPPQYGDPPIKR